MERRLISECLTTRWDIFINKFNALSKEEQEEYLLRQGYRRLADLLAHFAAWWEVGMQTIRSYQVDPSFQPLAYDVDAFNAAAVNSVKELDEDEVSAHFNKVRKEFIGLVETLTDEELQHPKINRQLEMELVGHLEEHEI